MSQFKTDKNKLSVWKVESESDLNDAFVALASSADNVGTICAAKISPEDVESLNVYDEEGDTPTFGINHKHCSITDLNYCTLGTVILSILNCLQDYDNRVVTKTRSSIKSLLVNAYYQKKIDMNNISDSVRNEIFKEICKIQISN